ncbi:MAG: Thioredoxin-like protein 1 [Piccolia ochrophora]|nr:MAG: Thioredoxin-like protein 1 [Piccolia ochrophora]
MPTFMIFKNGQAVSKILGADPRKLSDAVQKLVAEAESNGSAAEGGFSDVAGKTDSKERWLGATLPKGYKDITDQVDVKGLDLLNSDSDLGTARTLFEDVKPSAITTTDAGKGKSKASGEEKSPDWVESDTDEQMMLFIPFQSTLKIHSLHITSLPPQTTEGEDASNTPMRPKTINVYSNRAHVLGFEEAEDIPATQSITLSARDWDAESGTAKVELRFVKFQNVSSFVIFVVEGDGEGDKVRLDRIRIVGETGEKRGLGKLEKIGDEQGE